MRKFSGFISYYFHARKWKPDALRIRTIAGILFLIVIFQLQSFGQAANIDQIRNSNFYSTNTSDPLWVNGNAGSSNSHYTEGMSIAYRTLLTGLTNGRVYTIVIGYDTKHSDAMAIDYLTHFQRLEPHGPFGHAAEVINPLRMESGSSEYNMTVGAPLQFAFPVPDPFPAGYWNNSTNGSHSNTDDGTPVDDQPKNSFNAINSNAGEPNDNVMTIWNGSIISMNYVLQQSLVTNLSASETQLRIKFTAGSDSVLLAWGGHIASRLDWGSINGVPRSAGGISGSPYHMRLKELWVYNGTLIGNKACNKDSCEVGLGNQDRSLSAAAVVPPPGCDVSGPVKACPETSSLVYTTTVTGVTYLWELLNNTANAKISSGQGTNTITVTPDPTAATADFTPGGIFNVKLTTTSQGINTICFLGSSTEPGSNVVITDVNVSATAASNTTATAGCDATLDRVIGNTSQLQATVTGTGTAPYNYKWTDDGNTNGSFSDDAIANPVYTVTGNGEFFVKVVVTDADGCKDSVTKKICVVGAPPPCLITGPSPICPGTTNTYKYDPEGDGDANAIPTNFTAQWTLENNTNGATSSGSTTGNTFTVVSSSGNCSSSYTVKLTITSQSTTITAVCTKTVSVVDQTAPVLSGCPGNVTVDFCSVPAPAPVTATDNCPAPGTQVIVTFLETRSNGQNGCSNVITRKWTARDACGNTATCGQTITIVDKAPPLITCPPSVTIKFADNKDDLAKTGAAFASDNCAIASGFPTYSDNPASPAGGTTFTRTWRVQDDAGNTASCSQSITREAQPVARVSNTIQSETSAVAASSQLGPELKVKAYPNPFNDQVNFRFTPTKSGVAKMELFDMTGRRLSTVQIGYVQAGIERSHNYRVPALKRVSMFYRISINNQTGQGLLLSGAKSQ
jgi:hypothetical protein